MSVTGWANASGDQVTLYVEIDFSEAITDIGPGTTSTTRTLWDASTWGTSTWDDYGPVYTDVTQWVRSVDTNRNFSRDTNKYNASTATIVLGNEDGRFSPLNTSSPYRIGASTAIGPMRPARIRMELASGPYAGWSFTVFTGYVQAWNEHYPDTGSDAYVEVSLVGDEARIGNCIRNARTATGAGELPGSRVIRILDSVGWQNSAVLYNSEFALQATTLEGNAMDELQLVADSTGGAVWVDENGTFVYADRMALLDYARPFWAFVATPGTGNAVGETVYSDITIGYDAELVKNVISYANVGGTTQTVTSEPSRTLYGDRTQARADLIATTDAAANKAATKDLVTFRNPELRVEGVSIAARALDSTDDGVRWTGWPVLLFSSLIHTGARVILDRRVTGNLPNAYERQVVVSGVSHHITPDDWRVDLEFQSASVIGAFLMWDAGTWDDYQWTW